MASHRSRGRAARLVLRGSALMLLLSVLLAGTAAANPVGTPLGGGLAHDDTCGPLPQSFSNLELADDSALSQRSKPKTRRLGLGSDSAAGRRGKGDPLRLATQNTQGLSEEKLAHLVARDLDILALTENHGTFSDSRMATELGNCFISCGETEPTDPTVVWQIGRACLTDSLQLYAFFGCRILSSSVFLSIDVLPFLDRMSPLTQTIEDRCMLLLGNQASPPL